MAKHDLINELREWEQFFADRASIATEANLIDLRLSVSNAQKLADILHRAANELEGWLHDS